MEHSSRVAGLTGKLREAGQERAALEQRAEEARSQCRDLIARLDQVLTGRG